eukprot:11222927-Lingulodinium_polyedra.AAC.1
MDFGPCEPAGQPVLLPPAPGLLLSVPGLAERARPVGGACCWPQAQTLADTLAAAVFLEHAEVSGT